MTWDVCVVGAGPVGLCVALGLARRKRRVVVVEKNARTSEHSRAPAIWPRTQEILDQMDALGPFVAEGLVVEEVVLHDVDRGGALRGWQ